MSWIVWLVFVPVALYGLAVVNPSAAKAIFAELKRRWRLYLIQKYGEKLAEELFYEFRAEALKQGFDAKLIEKFIEWQREQVIDRLGRRFANARLGEPTPLERYH